MKTEKEQLTKLRTVGRWKYIKVTDRSNFVRVEPSWLTQDWKDFNIFAKPLSALLSMTSHQGQNLADFKYFYLNLA